MDRTPETVCVILAGGAGRRMASRDRHKSCFPIVGRPAIVRAIDTYKAAGLRRFLVVVGQMAEQVIETVTAAHPEVSFVYQHEPRGTGHAAAIAAAALEAQDYRGGVMVVMGDKIARPPVVRALLGQFADGFADVVLTALPVTERSTAGRIAIGRDGSVLGVVELPELKRARQRKAKITVAGRKFSPAQIEKTACGVNLSLYMFRFAALREALRNLRTDNVQGERYLTDTVEYIARRGRVETMFLADETDLMAFNTPAELVAVEEAIRKREKPARVSVARRKRCSSRALKPAGEWLKTLSGDTPKLKTTLRRLYGRDEALLDERRGAMVKLVERFARRFGPGRTMVLCRAPGRINLMGRHVDHRGGFVNVMAISRETLVAAGPRGDDLFTLRNLDAKRFPPREFRLQELLREFSWSDWMEFLGSRAAQSVVQSAPGDWSHYARAPLLRLQHECRDVQLRGMDCLVSGNIPMGAGLSSSSALVVAFAESAVYLNRLDVTMRDFVDLCGEGEWFVGSRGGSADHAAIRTSRAGYVSRIGFFPFRLAGEERFPSSLRMVIAHSGSQAVKSAGARDTFNQRVACYEAGLMLLRRVWPAAAGAEHLRDLAPDRLKVRRGEIYRALKRLAVRPSRRELRRLAGRHGAERIEELFRTHADVGRYDLRGVALYGIAECVRSERFAKALGDGDLKRIARFMSASHDGDRVVRFAANGRAKRHVVKTDDATLERLAAEDAKLTLQSGRYACSTEAIDRLVDLSCDVEGVVGAQLAGAGLGGCMMVLVGRGALDALMRRLRRDFYRPRKLPFGAHVCTPVAGAGLLKI